jgi:hypothetical protein
MSEIVEWIMAEAERTPGVIVQPGKQRSFPARDELTTGDTGEHRGGTAFHVSRNRGDAEHPDDFEADESRNYRTPGSDLIGMQLTNFQVEDSGASGLSWEEKRERRTYRGRTVAMLRKYMRYSMETGRLPSVLGREFFRARVTAYTVVAFEDRVIFVHDMETCLNKLDEFSRQLIARHILQDHDLEATARLLHCGKRTVQRYVPLALDLLSEILLDVGLLERTFPIREKACQGGETSEIVVSDSEERKNKS